MKPGGAGWRLRSFTICGAARAPAGPDELAAFETDTLAGLVRARGRRGPGRQHHRGEVIHLEQGQGWLGPAAVDDAARRRGRLLRAGLRGAARGTRLARAQALKTYFLFLSCGTKPRSTQ